MPQIAEYTAPQGQGLNPTETGVEAKAAAGRRIGGFYNQVAGAQERVGQELGQAVRNAGDTAVSYIDHQQISHGALVHQQILSGLTDKWDQTIKGDPANGVAPADPNDPAVADKFRTEVLEPTLQKFQEGFITEKGQQWAEHRTEQLRSHFFEKTSADMASLAANAVATNLKQQGNLAATTAFKSPDFHTVDMQLSTVEQSVKDVIGSSPSLKGVVASKATEQQTQAMKEQIIKAGAIGAIQASSDPEKTANEWTSKYGQYINGPEAVQLANQARAVIRQNRMQEKWEAHTADNEAKAVSQKALTDYDVRIHQDPSSVSVKDIAADMNLREQDKRIAIKTLDVAMKRDAVVQKGNENALTLYRDVIRSEDDPMKLRDPNVVREAYANHQIRKEDRDDILKTLESGLTPDGSVLTPIKKGYLNGIRPQIDKSNPLQRDIDPRGPQRMWEYTRHVEQQIKAEQTAGRDPSALFTPGDPKYLGEKIPSQFKTTLQESLKYATDKFTQPNTNLTAPGSTVMGTTTKDAPVEPPPGWAPKDARQGVDGKWYSSQPGPNGKYLLYKHPLDQ